MRACILALQRRRLTTFRSALLAVRLEDKRLVKRSTRNHTVDGRRCRIVHGTVDVARGIDAWNARHLGRVSLDHRTERPRRPVHSPGVRRSDSGSSCAAQGIEPRSRQPRVRKPDTGKTRRLVSTALIAFLFLFSGMIARD
jgi:hypothetical protein